MGYKEKLKQQLATYLSCSPDEVILTSKGRVGLYGMLKSLDIKKGDEVIIPAYTCVVVPSAVLYLGAMPVYVDIDPDTYNIDTNKIEEKITANTKVIMAQNTYGLSSDIDEIKKVAHKYNLKILEDCTHGFGGSYKGVLNGKNVDAAFYSSQWNKMFSTGIGGMTITTNPQMAKDLIAFEKSLAEPSFTEKFILRAQLFIKDTIGYSKLYWSAIKLYRFLTARNIIVGSSSGDELVSTAMPDDYLKGFSEVQAKRALRELSRLNKNIEHRKKIAGCYDECLKGMDITPPYVPDYAEHTFTKYPILVKDRDYIFVEAEKANLPIHDWFTSPLHPVEEKLLPLWKFDKNEFPIAMTMANHVINLPTDLAVSSNMAKKVVHFLQQHRSQLVNAEALLVQYV